MAGTRPWIAMLAAVGGAGCAPALDWREFVPEGSGVHVAFPCRPDRHARSVRIADANAQMQMLVCAAGDTTYALSFFDVTDPARIGAALDEMRRRAVSNVGGSGPRVAPLQIAGMTPNSQALRLAVAGRLPDGAAVHEHAAFFTRGLRVYQATVIGAQPPAQAVETFFAGLRFPR